MPAQTVSLVILATWFIFLALYMLIKYLLRERLFKDAPTISLANLSGQLSPPGSFLSKAGVIFIFIANIFTFFLIFAAALFPSVDQILAQVKLSLPSWVNILGCVLFVLGYLWGFFAVVFNPNYTPLYKNPPDQLILATRGAYAIIRHPRYAAEAFCNIALFLFSGIWLPLLGLLGWAAMIYQARAEEDYLMGLAGNVYGEYRKRTGMFFPRWMGG